MISTFRFSSMILVMLGLGNAQAQTIWNSNFITFSKESQSDWELEENQDRLTNDVWITRKSSMGIFNIRQEDGYTTDFSPMNTAWSFGTTAQLASLTFEPWELAINSSPVSAVNQDMVLHLIQDDIYVDIRFLSWEGGGAGGGFSYQRATANVLSVGDRSSLNHVQVYPNPSHQFLQLSGIFSPTELIMTDAFGKLVLSQMVLPDDKLDVSKLPQGLYFLMIGRVRTLKWIKI